MARRGELDSEIATFLHPAHLYSQEDVLDRPSRVPASPGVYGWWFRGLPPLVDARGCATCNGLPLLYIGISPKRPPSNGRPGSKQNLRKRLRQHYDRTAAASTLRRTLGCLLADELGLKLQCVGSSGRRTNFGSGEPILSEWMRKNAFVSWVVRKQPWDLEDALIGRLDLPLNLKDNSRNAFYLVLKQARARCLAEARTLPVLPR